MMVDKRFLIGFSQNQVFKMRRKNRKKKNFWCHLWAARKIQFLSNCMRYWDASEFKKDCQTLQHTSDLNQWGLKSCKHTSVYVVNRILRLLKSSSVKMSLKLMRGHLVRLWIVAMASSATSEKKWHPFFPKIQNSTFIEQLYWGYEYCLSKKGNFSKYNRAYQLQTTTAEVLHECDQYRAAHVHKITRMNIIKSSAKYVEGQMSIHKFSQVPGP